MRLAATFFIAVTLAGLAYADDSYDPKPSTAPIGSSFLRHFAYDFGFDLKELVKFEKRGFGRAEIITLALISMTTGKPLVDYGKRRLKENVTLKTIAEEASLDYPSLYQTVRTIKEDIEAEGDNNLPPPVFEDPVKKSENRPAKRTKRKKKEGINETPTP